MPTKLPAIPDVSSADIPLIVKRAITAIRARSLIREAEGPNTDPLDRVMTFRDAITLSLVEKSGPGFVASTSAAVAAAQTVVINNSTAEDATPPPAVTGVNVIAGHSTAFIEFTQPAYVKTGTSESNHAHTIIYRAAAVGSTSPGFGAAVELGHTETGFYADPIDGANVKYFYWLRNVSKANVLGPVAGGTDGFEATSGGVGATHVDLLTANRLFAVDGTFGNVLANTIGVLNASIKGTISSDDYVAGATGWALTKTGSGTLEVNSGIFRSTILGGGATAFGTGTGLFAGLDGGTYKFRVGDPAGANAQWTGTSFDVRNTAGDLVISAGDVVKLKASTELVDTEHLFDNSVSREVYVYVAGPIVSPTTITDPGGTPSNGDPFTVATAVVSDARNPDYRVQLIGRFVGSASPSTGFVSFVVRVEAPSSAVVFSQSLGWNTVDDGATQVLEINAMFSASEQGTYNVIVDPAETPNPLSFSVTATKVSFFFQKLFK